MPTSSHAAEHYASSDDALYRPVDIDELAALINAGSRQCYATLASSHIC